MSSTIKTVFIVMGSVIASFLLWTLFFRAGNTIGGKDVKGGAVTYAETRFELAAADYYERYCFIPNSALHADFDEDFYLNDSESPKPTISDCYSSDKIKFMSVEP